MTVFFVPLFVLFVAWGGLPFFFLISAIALLGLFEFYRIVETRQIKPWVFPGMLMAAGLLLAVSAPRTFSLVVTLSVMFILLYQMGRKNLSQAITNCATTIFGPLYVVGLLSYLIVLRKLDGGQGLVFTVWFITWIGDSGAFVIGKSRGKHKLFPRISPQKTVEGAIGGVGSAILASFMAYFILKAIFGRAPFPISHSLLLGLTLGILGILGDLSESLLKRDGKVKDSGGNVPGHGGILDTFDSLLFTVPAMYYYAVFILHR
jgi:phosphatidate cytidylyltransferase